ncbi:putative flavonol synthase 5 [Cardamine amara subsp. amara]|uniref:Flavonol synthase 5 n=1 Tax=Cardamine amara subsp. amara TaxID=228776 RepID=A0ABD1AB23_CARAN
MVVNHGIPVKLMQQLQVVAKQFFELPAAEKEAVAAKADKDIEGEVNHEEYTKQVKKLMEKLLGWLSEGLGLPSEVLTQSIGGETAEYVIRFNFYPPCPQSEFALGAAEHTDIGALTLLVPNEVQGLQAFKDEHWFDLDYINPAVVVIIGDQLMRMSNGRYKSVRHRATLDKANMRISWPVFVAPRHYVVVVGPLPELTGDENPPKFESIVYKDYLLQKIRDWALEDHPLY